MANEQFYMELKASYQKKLIDEKHKLWDRYVDLGDTLGVSSKSPVVFKDEYTILKAIKDDYKYGMSMYGIDISKHPEYQLSTYDNAEFKKLSVDHIQQLQDKLKDCKMKYNSEPVNDALTKDQNQVNMNFYRSEADKIRAKLNALGVEPIEKPVEADNIKWKSINQMNEYIYALQTEWWTVALDPYITPEQLEKRRSEIHTKANDWRDRIRMLVIEPPDKPEKYLWADYVAHPEADKVKNILESKGAKSARDLSINDLNEAYNPSNPNVGIYKYYRSFSGCDAIAELVFPGEKRIILGEVTTLSYSIYRSKKPIQVLGQIGPRGFTKGPRVIAGSIIFTVTNIHWVNEVREMFPDLFKGMNKIKADELPPFDIIINYANEYGAAAYYVIYAASIIEEGQVVSVEDSVTENVCQFIARDIDVTAPTGTKRPDVGVWMRPAESDYLGRYKIEDIVSDDVYERNKIIKDKMAQMYGNYIPSEEDDIKHPTSVVGTITKKYGDLWIQKANASVAAIKPNTPKGPEGGVMSITVQLRDKKTDMLLIPESVTYTAGVVFNIADIDKPENYVVTTTKQTASSTFTIQNIPLDNPNIQGDKPEYGYLVLSGTVDGRTFKNNYKFSTSKANANIKWPVKVG